MITYQNIQFKDSIGDFLRLAKKVKHGFSWGKSWGNMSCAIGDLEIAKNNTIKFLSEGKFGSIEDSINMIPQHQEKIVWIDQKIISNLENNTYGKEIECDAFFTSQKKLTLVVKPADCVIAIVYAKLKDQPIIGFIHAGWRGVDLGLPRKAINYLVKEMGVDINTIEIGITPHLLPSSFIAPHLNEYHHKDNWQDSIIKMDNGYMVDMGKATINQLIEAGVKTGNIEYYQIDTFENALKGEAFSYRAHKNETNIPNGRFMVVVRLEN